MYRIRNLSKLTLAAFCAVVFSAGVLTPTPSLAADKFVPRPVWRSWNARTYEDKQSEYLRFIAKIHYEELRAWKEAGLLIDYKVLIREPRGPDDPDVTIMYEYANLSAMDKSPEIWSAVSKKALAKFENDKDAQKMIAESDSLRKFIGWSPVARELVFDQ